MAPDAVQPIIAPRPVPGRDVPGQGRSVVVKAGDSLSKMALEVYGRADEKTLALLLKNNPGIADPDLISIGQEIYFPPLQKEMR
jgi:nucleoid-associated protein YgaU